MFFAALLLAASGVLRAEPSVEESLNEIRRLEMECRMDRSSGRLEAWRNAIADFEKSHLRSLDIALLKARFHYYGELNAYLAVKALKPYMHHASSRPEIPYFIWRICDDIPAAAGGDALQPSLGQMATADENMIPTLRSYWASFLPADFRTDALDAHVLAKCSGGCTREEGLRAWRRFLDILEQAEIKRIERDERRAAEERVSRAYKKLSEQGRLNTGKSDGDSGGASLRIGIDPKGE